MYKVYAKNCKEVIIHNAQNKQDAIKKAEMKLGYELEEPKVKFVLDKFSKHYNPKSFRFV